MSTTTPLHNGPVVDERFAMTMEVHIRLARETDLRPMEWYGMFTPHRRIIRDTFARQQSGEVAMLLAVINDSPAGQVWIDFVRRRAVGAGMLWAARIFPWFQRHGLGRRLVLTAESILALRDFRRSELHVEKHNESAQRFYEALGYQLTGSIQEEFSYRTPAGDQRTTSLDQWVFVKNLVESDPEKGP